MNTQSAQVVKTSAGLILGAALVSIVVGGSFLLGRHWGELQARRQLLGVMPLPSGAPSTAPTTAPEPGFGEGVACTMDAMECPDGTYVGRTGPKCEFICPGSSGGAAGGAAGGGSSELTTFVTYRSPQYGYSFEHPQEFAVSKVTAQTKQTIFTASQPQTVREFTITLSNQPQDQYYLDTLKAGTVVFGERSFQYYVLPVGYQDGPSMPAVANTGTIAFDAVIDGTLYEVAFSGTTSLEDHVVQTVMNSLRFE